MVLHLVSNVCQTRDRVAWTTQFILLSQHIISLVLACTFWIFVGHTWLPDMLIGTYHFRMWLIHEGKNLHLIGHCWLNHNHFCVWVCKCELCFIDSWSETIEFIEIFSWCVNGPKLESMIIVFVYIFFWSFWLSCKVDM